MTDTERVNRRFALMDAISIIEACFWQVAPYDGTAANHLLNAARCLDTQIIALWQKDAMEKA